MKLLQLFQEDLSQNIDILRKNKDIDDNWSKIPRKARAESFGIESVIATFVRSAFSDAVGIGQPSSFAVVYRSDKYVIRVTHTPDPAYNKWVEYATTHKSKYFPNYYIHFTYGNGKNTVTIMDHYGDLLETESKTVNYLSRLNPYLTRDMKLTDPEWQEWYDRFMKTKPDNEFFQVYMSLKEWCDSLGEDFYWDGHKDNLMRSNKHDNIVFIDPIASKSAMTEMNDTNSETIEDIDILYIHPSLKKKIESILDS